MLTFVHISDTHIPADPNYNADYAPHPPHEGARALVQQVNALPFMPDFVLHTGDVAYDPYPEAYAACKDILGEIKAPVHYVAGNHDASAALQNALVQRGGPKMQLHYEFEVNGVQVAIVDSNGPADPPAGYMTENQLAWINAICTADDDRPLVIATHHNPTPGGIPWLDDFMGIQNTDAFHAAILPAKERLRGVFFGHVHQNLDIYRDGVLYCATLSSWAQFHAWPGQEETTHAPHDGPGFSVVTVTENQTLIRRHRFTLTD
jgi:3',5'-cyclic-AMP phosphodiesterase